MNKQIITQKSRIKYGKTAALFLLLVIYIHFAGLPVYAQELFEVAGKCIEGQKVTLSININDETSIDGFDIYRTQSAGGDYQYVGNIETEKYNADKDYKYYNDYDYDEDADYTYTDSTVLDLYQTYYYRVEAYQYLDEEKIHVQSADTEVVIVGAGPQITYQDDNGGSFSVDMTDEAEYEMVKTIKGNSTLSTSFKDLMHGATYTYRIYAYKNINGSQIPSISSEMKSITMDYYAYEGERYSQKVKRAYGSEKAKRKNLLR